MSTDAADNFPQGADYPEPVVGEVTEIAEGVDVFATPDGRVFIDAENFTEAFHMVAHFTGPLTAMFKGEDYAAGQHDAFAVMHETAAETLRVLVGLDPHLPPAEDNTEGTTDTDDLEAAFAAPSFGEGEGDA
jgi:hypothetical protein